MLQYLISGSDSSEIISTAISALDNGCRWIRLDLSALSPAKIEEIIKSLKDKSNSLDAFISIENDLDSVSTLKVSGIHLGLNSNISAPKARKQLGEETIIGVTIADEGDVPFVPRTAIDYIAIASEDIDCCRRIVKQIKTTGLEEPVIAPYSHGTPLENLMSTGVNGIVANNNDTPVAMLPILLDKLNTFLEDILRSI